MNADTLIGLLGEIKESLIQRESQLAQRQDSDQIAERIDDLGQAYLELAKGLEAREKLERALAVLKVALSNLFPDPGIRGARVGPAAPRLEDLLRPPMEAKVAAILAAESVDASGLWRDIDDRPEVGGSRIRALAERGRALRAMADKLRDRR